MKVYKQAHPNTVHVLYVQPGTDHPENTEWIDTDKKPKMLQVLFKNGVAEVDKNLGHYLIEKQMAESSPIIILNGTVL